MVHQLICIVPEGLAHLDKQRASALGAIASRQLVDVIFNFDIMRLGLNQALPRFYDSGDSDVIRQRRVPTGIDSNLNCLPLAIHPESGNQHSSKQTICYVD